MLKYTLYFIALVATVILSVLFYFGGTCILTTVLFYGLLYAFFRLVVKLLLRGNVPLQKNWLLLTGVVLGILLADELVLRYVTHTTLNYSEQNNNFFSFDRRVAKLERLVRTYKYHNASPWGSAVRNDTVIKGNQEYSYAHRFNSMGFRDDEPGTDVKEITIVAIGDSYTEGLGAPQDSTYPRLLQNTLLRQMRGMPYRVLNAGVAGGDVISNYMVLKNCFMPFNPATVVLLINSTDINDISEKGGLERYMAEGKVRFPARPWWAPVAEVSLVFRTLMHRGFGYNFNCLTAAQQAQVTKDAQNKIAGCIVNQLLPLTRQNNCQLVVVYQPTPTDLYIDELSPVKRRIAEHPEIYTLDLYPLIKQHLDNGHTLDDIYWPADKHFNANGYAYVAATIFNELRTAFIPPDSISCLPAPHQISN